MSAKERGRLVVMARVREGKMRIREASEVLDLGYRQTRRVYRRYLREGDKGLIHRSRGWQSNRAKPEEVKQGVLTAYKEHYWDFGPTLASEKLMEREKYEVDHETLRRWLLAAGLWQRQRKRPKHRERRERKAHFGELVQLDGSHHDWFEDREEGACLMNLVDDATGITLAVMSEEETTVAAMQVLWAWVEKYGIPKALYVDWKNVYLTKREPTLEEQLSGQLPLTQFGRACKKLGVEIIPASSPQAKGRVERKHGVYQDRWVKELRLEGLQDLQSANRLLPLFAERLNAKFAVPARSEADFHRVVPEGIDLKDVFCFEETRTVSNDWVVRYKNRFFQIVQQSNLPPAKGKVQVQEHLDGSLHLVYRDREVLFKEIDQLPEKRQKISEKPKTTVPQKRHVPSLDHPWRHMSFRSLKRKAAWNYG
jgi:transposase